MLSLVCKRWYEIVRNSTGFRTNVILRPTWDVSKLDPIRRFAQLCHQRIKDKLLDIAMDFSNVLPFRIYAGRVLDEYPDHFPLFSPQSRPSFAKEAQERYDDDRNDDYGYFFKDAYYDIPRSS